MPLTFLLNFLHQKASNMTKQIADKNIVYLYVFSIGRLGRCEKNSLILTSHDCYMHVGCGPKKSLLKNFISWRALNYYFYVLVQESLWKKWSSL